MDIMQYFLSHNGKFRFVVCKTEKTVNKIREIHKMSYPVANAVSRFITAAALVSSNLKSGDVQGFYLDLNGPVGGIRCEVNSYGHIKGYALYSQAGVDETDKNYVMDLNQLLGTGTLTVTKVLAKGKTPFVSTISYPGGSLALLFADYLNRSEQIKSAVMVSNFMNPDGVVKLSGGILVQAMPDATERDVEEMEKYIEKLPPLSEILKQTDTTNEIALLSFPHYKPFLVGERHLVFKCTCSREKVLKVLNSLSEEDRRPLLLENSTYLVVCEYCKKEYIVAEEEVEKFS